MLAPKTSANPSYLDVVKADREREAKILELETDNAHLRKINDILRLQANQLEQTIEDLRNANPKT